MKGLLYNSFIQQKNNYIAAGVVWVIFVILGIVLVKNVDSLFFAYPLLSVSVTLMPLFFGVIITDGGVKNTEKMMKCGYTKYVLTSGVTHSVYIISELVLFLINTAISFCVTAMGYGVYKLFGIEPVGVGEFRIATALLLATLIYLYTSDAVTFFCKSAEIANFTVFFAGVFLFGIFFTDNMLSGENTVIIIDNKALLILSAVTAAVLAADSVIMYLRLRKDIK